MSSRRIASTVETNALVVRRRGTRRAPSGGRSRRARRSRSTARRRRFVGFHAALEHLRLDLVPQSSRQRSTGPSRPNSSWARTARSNATHAITFEWVKCRFGPAHLPDAGVLAAPPFLEPLEQLAASATRCCRRRARRGRGSGRGRRSPRRRRRAGAAAEAAFPTRTGRDPSKPGSQSSTRSSSRRSPASPYMICTSAGSPATARSSHWRQAIASSR